MVNVIMRNDLLGGRLKDKTILTVKKGYQEQVFTPEAMLRAMDLSGGQLSSSCIKILRAVENQGQSNFHVYSHQNQHC